MILQIDTREKKPLDFNGIPDYEFIEKIQRVKLEIGDYGAVFKDGHQPPYFFERKSIPDLFNTLGKDYKRFQKEIARSFNREEKLFIIIEGSYSKVLKGYVRSRLEGITVIRKLMTLWIKHGVQPIFCNSREEMAEFILQFYIGVGKDYIRRRGVRKL